MLIFDITLTIRNKRMNFICLLTLAEVVIDLFECKIYLSNAKCTNYKSEIFILIGMLQTKFVVMHIQMPHL